MHAERAFRGLETTCVCKQNKRQVVRGDRGDREADRVDTAVPDENTGCVDFILVPSPPDCVQTATWVV